MPAHPPGLDLDRLRAYLDDHAPGFADGPLSAEVIAGGKSNLTYHLRTADGRTWVLRRPPLGHVLATAHDMAREYRVMSALGSTAVPVPRTHFLCPDPDVLGAAFYVMEDVAGRVYRNAQDSEALTAKRATSIAYTLIDVLADLHGVDPSTVGLTDFGRPEGFLARQLKRWHTQLEGSRSRPLPGMDELFDELSARMPESGPPAIVHGDYRLDNVIIGEGDRVAAVLDWEMATLGDPLTDLGLFLVYWGRLTGLPGGALPTGVNPSVGFPSGEQVIARYATRRAVDLRQLPWYVAFACFKLAVISEGIYFRFTAGQTVGAGFEHMGEVVVPLVNQGRAALTGVSPPISVKEA
jgi:aminoglycoside phosphotransferase (APT) family kinase protein